MKWERDVLVAFIYFAKVNVNSKIYDLYRDPKQLDGILDRLITRVDQKRQINITKDKCFIKFISLECDVERRYIGGRIVKIFEDDIQMYDEASDDIKPLPTEKLARSVAFFFDLRTERVAFVTGRYFGYQQFCNYFKILLDDYDGETEYEVYLEKNADLLREKIKMIKKVLRVDICLVAPNCCSQLIIAKT